MQIFQKSKKIYEAPKVEIIEIEPQGLLCASAGGDGGITGTGFQFGTTGGTWGGGTDGSGFSFGTSEGYW